MLLDWTSFVLYRAYELGIIDMDDWFDDTWLERTYSGAPDECGQCYREGKIVKAEDCTEH